MNPCTLFYLLFLFALWRGPNRQPWLARWTQPKAKVWL